MPFHFQKQAGIHGELKPSDLGRRFGIIIEDTFKHHLSQ